MADSKTARNDLAKILVTITDGEDSDDDLGSVAFNAAISMVRNQRVFSLSCGIGHRDVDHRGLAELARLERSGRPQHLHPFERAPERPRRGDLNGGGRYNCWRLVRFQATHSTCSN